MRRRKNLTHVISNGMPNIDLYYGIYLEDDLYYHTPLEAEH